MDKNRERMIGIDKDYIKYIEQDIRNSQFMQELLFEQVKTSTDPIVLTSEQITSMSAEELMDMFEGNGTINIETIEPPSKEVIDHLDTLNYAMIAGGSGRGKSMFHNSADYPIVSEMPIRENPYRQILDSIEREEDRRLGVARFIEEDKPYMSVGELRPKRRSMYAGEHVRLNLAEDSYIEGNVVGQSMRFITIKRSDNGELRSIMVKDVRSFTSLDPIQEVHDAMDKLLEGADK